MPYFETERGTADVLLHQVTRGAQTQKQQDAKRIADLEETIRVMAAALRKAEQDNAALKTRNLMLGVTVAELERKNREALSV